MKSFASTPLAPRPRRRPRPARAPETAIHPIACRCAPCAAAQERQHAQAGTWGMLIAGMLLAIAATTIVASFGLAPPITVIFGGNP